MPVIKASELVHEEVDGKRVQLLATPDLGATDVFVLRGIFTAGAGNPPHRHDHQETVIVLRGAGTYVIAGAASDVSAGDVVLVPAGAVHSFTAVAETESIGIFRAGTRTFAPDGDELE